MRRSNARRVAAISGSAASSTGLDPGRAVDVHHCGIRSTHSPHPVHEEHEGARLHAVEDLRRPVGEHHRRHGAELLAALDGVHPAQVLGPAGVAEQAAVAERPGPYSLRPWNQPTTAPSAKAAATSSARSAGRS